MISHADANGALSQAQPLHCSILHVNRVPKLACNQQEPSIFGTEFLARLVPCCPTGFQVLPTPGIPADRAIVLTEHARAQNRRFLADSPYTDAVTGESSTSYCTNEISVDAYVACLLSAPTCFARLLASPA
jgi:hypothetical protein